MQKILLILIVVWTVALVIPCSAENIGSRTAAELIENGKLLDGSEVSMTVEMIGDVMSRGEFAWVNGLDSTGAMGFWIPSDQASKVKVLGNGKFKGDTVRISGIFHRACQEHGGDMDIHVSYLAIIKPGYSFTRKIPDEKIRWSVLLTVTGLIIGGFYYKVRLS